MRLLCKPRGLNDTETYPCSLTDIKKVFKDLDIVVGFGVEKEYQFDTAARHRPKLHGKVIASFSINRRLPFYQHQGYLDLFSVNKNIFKESQKSLFTEKYIPLLLNWYIAKSSILNLGGVEEILIVWDGFTFVVHEMKYA